MIELKSMELDDEDKQDTVTPYPMPDKPDFPYGLRISLTDKEFEKLGIDEQSAEVGGTVHLHAMARITSVNHTQNDGGDKCCRVELQIESLAIDSFEDEEDEPERY